MDIFAALLMLRALALAPVTALAMSVNKSASVIQPVSGCGPAILSIFSHFYLKEVMNAVDWVGITLAGFGTISNLVLEVRSEKLLLYLFFVFHGWHLLFSSCLWNMMLLRKSFTAWSLEFYLGCHL